MFPNRFTNSALMTFNSHYKNKLVNQLKYILEEKASYLEASKKEDDYFHSQIIPKNLDGANPENVIYHAKREFEKLCVILMNQGIPQPDKLSVFRFFTSLDYFEKKNKPKQK
jgi:hypothetical protein